MKKIIILLIILLFLPASSLYSVTEPSKGLAMAYPIYQEDLINSGIDWWYAWSSNQSIDSKYVPMSWCGEDPNLSLDYSGYVLLFNEPEVASQCNISPYQGINYYKVLKDKYPNAKWVVGNTTFWGGWQYWLNLFWDLCNADIACTMPDYWGVHVYISGDAETYIPFVRTELETFHNKLGKTFWITEFAEINGNIVTDDALLYLFKSTSYINRWAYFTNRSQTTDPWVIDGWNIDLFDWNTGEPTAIGEWYMHGITHRVLLPILIKP